MLRNSFSFLPVLHEDEWKLVSDLSLAKFLLRGARRAKVRVPLEMAVAEGQICLTDPVRVGPHENEAELAAKMESGVPALVVEEKRLLGIITPFDLL